MFEIYQILREISEINVFIALIMPFIIIYLGRIYTRNTKFKKIYKIIWKKSSLLKRRSLLANQRYCQQTTIEHYRNSSIIRDIIKIYLLKYIGIGQKKDTYYERREDDTLLKLLNGGKNALIIGSPGIGKTTAIYQALINSDLTYDVIIPRMVNINIEFFSFPIHYMFWRPKLIIFDDLDKFVEYTNFDYLLRKAFEQNFTIIATCRLGREYKIVTKKLFEKNLSLETIFGKNIIFFDNISEKDEKIIVIDSDWSKIKFVGTSGSHYSTKETKFEMCDDNEKTILNIIKKLQITGLYKKKEIYTLNWIKIVAEKNGLELTNLEWNEWLNKLECNDIIKLEHDVVRINDICLDSINLQEPVLTIFNKMLNIFTKETDSEALDLLGNKAYEVGTIDLEIANYMKIAIDAYEEALKISSYRQFPIDYAATQNNIGNAYRTLAEVENKSENSKKAIQAYEEALKIKTLDYFSLDYSLTQNNLGNAYTTLAEVEEKTANSKKAIRAYEEALKGRIIDLFPIDYAATQNNLGNAYRTLAEVQEKTANSKKAIWVYEEALKVRTIDLFPIDYAATQNNLGNAYRTLAEVQEKTKNSKKAIQAYEEALKVRTIKRFPFNYAATQNNLGNAYTTLAEVEEKTKNSKKAIQVYEEALEVRTIKRFPFNYAATQNNLGNAYRTLAEVQEKTANSKKAIQAYEEALRIMTLKMSPTTRISITNNLEILKGHQAEAGNNGKV